MYKREVAAEVLSRQYTSFLESTSDLVYLKDTDLRYLACSKPLADMLGDIDGLVLDTAGDYQSGYALLRKHPMPSPPRWRRLFSACCVITAGSRST